MGWSTEHDKEWRVASEAILVEYAERDFYLDEDGHVTNIQENMYQDANGNIQAVDEREHIDWRTKERDHNVLIDMERRLGWRKPNKE